MTAKCAGGLEHELRWLDQPVHYLTIDGGIRRAGHDTEVGASMPDKLTSAQRRVLDFLLADESGDYIIVPFSVTRDIRPIDALLELHLIEMEWRPVPNPPGSYDAHYRAAARSPHDR